MRKNDIAHPINCPFNFLSTSHFCRFFPASRHTMSNDFVRIFSCSDHQHVSSTPRDLSVVCTAIYCREPKGSVLTHVMIHENRTRCVNCTNHVAIYEISNQRWMARTLELSLHSLETKVINYNLVSELSPRTTECQTTCGFSRRIKCEYVSSANN